MYTLSVAFEDEWLVDFLALRALVWLVCEEPIRVLPTKVVSAHPVQMDLK
jgi:hypothetical protein